MITGPEAGITRDSISIDWDWTDQDGTVHPVRLIDTAGLRKRAKVDDKLERLSAHDTKPRDRFRRSGGAAARRARAGWRRRTCASPTRCSRKAARWSSRSTNGTSPNMPRRLFNGVKAALLEGPQPAQGRAVADRVGRDRQGHRPVDRRGVRSARELVAARRHGRAQSLVRQGGRDQPAARARRQAHQAALHHPDQDAPAELRHFRQPGRPIADQLSSLSAQFDAPRLGAWAGAAAADDARDARIRYDNKDE